MKHLKLFESNRSLYEIAKDTFSYLLDDKEIKLDDRRENVIAILINNPEKPKTLDEHITNSGKTYETLSDIKIGIEQLKLEFEDIKFQYHYYNSNVCIIIYYGEYRFSE
jgi:hypothetical protein